MPAWYTHQSFSFPDEKCQGLDFPLMIISGVPNEASSLCLKKSKSSRLTMSNMPDYNDTLLG